MSTVGDPVAAREYPEWQTPSRDRREIVRPEGSNAALTSGVTSGAYAIVDVSSWEAIAAEEMGKKSKVWLVDPPGQRWLFKSVREDQQGARGEDWAEKLAAEVAQSLGIPAAAVELAHRQRQDGNPRGVISRSVMPDEQHALHHGNELLRGLVTAYDAQRLGEVPGYTLDAVWSALQGVGVPPDSGLPLTEGRALFVGYLMLDALIANTDRHHQNWAVIRTPQEADDYLSPSFDHATSLGFQEPQERKQLLLDEGRVRDWTAKARSKFEGRPSPMAVAREALQQASGEVTDFWLGRLEALHEEVWVSRIEAVPADLMSQVDRRFAAEVIRVNREELLNVR